MTLEVFAMAHALMFWILLLATLMSGLLAGISLDKSFVQLPTRLRIGLAAYAAYSRAADLGGGLFWYPLLGLGAPLLAAVAAVLAVAHVATTARAAPVLLRVHRQSPDEATMRTLFRRFAIWQGVRCAVQAATFAALLWALVAYGA
jgi:hypothetical protein